MATLTYMPAEHVPVLAPELVALVAPEPGDLVIDCTFAASLTNAPTCASTARISCPR